MCGLSKAQQYGGERTLPYKNKKIELLWLIFPLIFAYVNETNFSSEIWKCLIITWAGQITIKKEKEIEKSLVRRWV